jgi:CRP-like cAMP-binding protein
MDARKLKERATEAFSKGKFLKAAEAYAEYCAADPKDGQARLRMGDAWSKAGQKPKAIAAYQGAAETFAKDGFLPRAIAASKLILELDPSHKGVQQMLADLYARKTGGSASSSSASRPSAGAAAVAAAIELKTDTPVPVPAVIVAPAPPAPVAVEASPVVVQAPPGAEAEPVVEIEVEGATPASNGASIDFGVDAAPAAAPDVAATIETAQVEVAVQQSAPAPGKAAAAPAPKVYEIDLDEPAESAPSAASDLAPSALPGAPANAATALEMEVVAPTGAPIEVSVPLSALEKELVAPKPELEVVTPQLEVIAEPGAPNVSHEEPVSAASLAAPPGMKPKRANVPSVVGEAAPRIWLPQGFTPPPPSAPPAPLPVASVTSMPGPHHAPAQTDLEKSLEAFSQFDIDEQPMVDEAMAAPPSAPQPPAGATATSHIAFTELELEGDSLLHAVEEAAVAGLSSRGQATAPAIVEESLANDEPKVEPGALPKIPLFSDLPADAFIALFEQCPLRRYGVGEIIIAQGTQGDSFFVICAGSVKVFRVEAGQRRDLARLDEGAFFGEMALLSATARTASVEGNDEDTQLLEISAGILAELSQKYATVATALKKFCRQRLLQNVMGSSPLFAPFSRQDRRALVEKFRAREVNKGDLIIRQGEKSDGLYIVLSGEVGVSVGASELATLKEGEIFGEMSLLTKQPAAANVRAAKRTSLLRLPKEDFDRLIMSHPQILVLVSELTDERKKHNANVPAAPTGDEPLV